MNYVINIVTGAPGSGKSSALRAFIALGSQYVAFDIDWLAKSSIYNDSSTWGATVHYGSRFCIRSVEIS